VANVLASVAEWERDTISKRTSDALRERQRQGVRLGPERLVPPATARRIRNLRSRGWSFRRIAARLNEEGVPPAGGGQQWDGSTIRRIAVEQRPERRRKGVELMGQRPRGALPDWKPHTARQKGILADQAKAHGLPEERVLEDVIVAPHEVKRLIEPSEVADVVAFLLGPSGPSPVHP
jgi:Recombinase